MKFIKISLYSVFALVLVAIVAGVYFIVTFDANDYKAQISDQVKQRTGRELSLGDIKPSVFPWVGLELQQIALSNAKGFNDLPMLQAERVDVRIELLPLLKQEVHVDTLRLHGLDLNLQKDKQGRTNWNDILEKRQATSALEKGEVVTATESVASKDTENARGIPFFMVNGIEIKNAQALWDDAQLGQKITVKELNVTSGVMQLGKTIPLQISARVQIAEPVMNVQIQTEAGINVDLDTQQLALNGLSLKLNAGLPDFDIEQLVLHLKTDVAGNLEKQTFTLSTISLDVDAKGKAIPGGEIKASLVTAIKLDLLAQLMQLKDLSIQTLGLNLKSQLQVSELIDAPSVQGSIGVAPFNLKKVLSELAISLPEMQNDKALQMASINFDIKAGTDSISLESLKITLDESSINGFVSVNDFAQPKIKYNLKLDKINLDSYLPPSVNETVSAEVSESSAAQAVASKDAVIDLPVEMLRSLGLDGGLSVDTIKGFDQTIRQLNVETLASDGVIKISKLDAKLLEGSVSSTAQLDVRKNTPLYQLNLKGEGIKADSIVNPLLQEMLGDSAVSISGVSNMTVSLDSKGQTINQLTANSNGQLAFNADKAVMQGVDAEYFVRKAVTAYLEEKKIPVKEEWRGQYTPQERTAIKSLSATATIQKGVIQNNDLLLNTSRFNVTGAGSINLPTETLNYLTVIDVQPINVKTTAEQLLDIPVPVMITGDFEQPVISMDKKSWTQQAGKALTQKVKDDVKKKVEKKKEEKIDELKNKLKDKFKGLF